MFKSMTTLGGAVAVLLWFTGPAWAPRDCPDCVKAKPGGKVSNPADKTFKGKGVGNPKFIAPPDPERKGFVLQNPGTKGLGGPDTKSPRTK